MKTPGLDLCTIDTPKNKRVVEISVWEDSKPRVHAGVKWRLFLPTDIVIGAVMLKYEDGAGVSATEPDPFKQL